MKKFYFLTVILLIAVLFLGFNMRFPIRYLNIIAANAGELEFALVLAVIKTESSFRENVVSHAGAQGLMQLMPATAEELISQLGLDAESKDIFLPEINIALGTAYLNKLKQMYGCEQLALVAYNAGQGRVNSWLQNPEISSDGKTLDSIPFNETRNYLQRVNRNKRLYRIRLWFHEFFRD